MRKARRAPTGPPIAMTCPEVWNKPTPTAPENAIPMLRKQAQLASSLEKNTSNVMPFESTIQMIVLENFVTEPFDQLLAGPRRKLMGPDLIYAQFLYFANTVRCHVLGTADALQQQQL